jgi:hypothetical protein
MVFWSGNIRNWQLLCMGFRSPFAADSRGSPQNRKIDSSAKVAKVDRFSRVYVVSVFCVSAVYAYACRHV